MIMMIIEITPVAGMVPKIINLIIIINNDDDDENYVRMYCAHCTQMEC